MGEQEREFPEDEEAPAPFSQTSAGRVRLVESEEDPRPGFERVVPYRGGMERR